MSFNNKSINQFEKIYSLLNFDTRVLTSASATRTIFTSEANMGYCMVVSAMVYVKSIAADTGTTNFYPRFGVVGDLARICPQLNIGVTADEAYCNNITFPHTIAPSTAVVISNANGSVATFRGITHIYMRVLYFGV